MLIFPKLIYSAMESQVVAFYILVSLFENLGENTEHK